MSETKLTKVIGSTDLRVFPLCLGGNVFSWTADERASFAVLDAYAAAGGNFVDTADVYSAWMEGHSGGESEEIIGRWHTSRKSRDRVVIATKVGMKPDRQGLAPTNVRAAAEESLERLQTDWIDLYFVHVDDEKTPLEETLSALDALVREGKVRYIGASNHTAPRLAEALAVSDRTKLARYVALQPRYNLMDREEYESELAGLCERERLSCVPYFGLAQGFLTGKYRGGQEAVDSPRAESAQAYLDDRGHAVLAALDMIADEHNTTTPAVALAWLLTRPAVASPIASARSREQLAELLPVADLRLTADEVSRLTEASANGGGPADT